MKRFEFIRKSALALAGFVDDDFCMNLRTMIIELA